MLSIASFAAAVGACISGIFGMNLRSTLENSVVGFLGDGRGHHLRGARGFSS